MKICPIIISGGVGSRLWPLSKSVYPKQFVKIIGKRSLFQETLLRFHDSNISLLDPLIVCNEDHKYIVAEQLKEIGLDTVKVILEPEQKNTAPAITLASIYLKQKYINEDLAILVLPADHMIEPKEVFLEQVINSLKYLTDGTIATFGIKPDSPNTGFGYIELGEQISDNGILRQVKSFKEKPNFDLAKKYLESDHYLWNSGIYLINLKTLLTSIKTVSEDILSSCKDAIDNSQEDENFIKPDKASFISCKSISIDYALIEKFKETKLNLINSFLDLNWSDVGSLKALSEVLPRDKDSNSIIGDIEQQQTQNSLLYSDSGLLAALNLKDMLVVKHENTVLVAPKSENQNIGKFVEELKNKKRPEVFYSAKEIRPWGSFEVLYESEVCKVKKIIVNTHSRLSLQMHKQRSEHWIVTKGIAVARCHEDSFVLHENESIFIPQGAKHSLSNESEVSLEIVEVQTGTYLGEDDIVRFEDIYGRVDS